MWLSEMDHNLQIGDWLLGVDDKVSFVGRSEGLCLKKWPVYECMHRNRIIV